MHTFVATKVLSDSEKYRAFWSFQIHALEIFYVQLLFTLHLLIVRAIFIFTHIKKRKAFIWKHKSFVDCWSKNSNWNVEFTIQTKISFIMRKNILPFLPSNLQYFFRFERHQNVEIFETTSKVAIQKLKNQFLLQKDFQEVWLRG